MAKPLRPALWLVALLILLAGCGPSAPQAVKDAGSVFGTRWSLTYLPTPGGPEPAVVRAALEEAFSVVNASMNSYDPQSTISRFNALPPGAAMEVDWDFAYVLNEAITLQQKSGGAYDVTIAPLLALWGFGPDGPTDFPEASAIALALSRTGMSNFEWDASIRSLTKVTAGASLELSSIAKGYGVDLAADALDELGIENFMFEIGGEIQLRGQSPRGDNWRIAVEQPEMGARAIQAALSLTDTGVATSGDYRNYFEREGQRYSHLIDPRTGYPIVHDLVSVTVVHPSTTLADAWATALAIMGKEAALRIAASEGLAVYLVSREGDALSEQWSPAFEPLMVSAGQQG